MREQILTQLNNPAGLESLYRSDKSAFRRTFRALYPEVADAPVARFWHERLNHVQHEFSATARRDLGLVLLLALLAGLVAKLPQFFGIDEDFFYPRNIGSIVFPALAAFFALKNRLAPLKAAGAAAVLLGGAVFINLLPAGESDTLILSCMHLLIVQWAVLLFAFSEGLKTEGSLRFLKFNGDGLVMTGLIVIAGGILTGLTLGLFSVIGLRIEDFWFQNIVVFGLPAAPILGTYLVQANPGLVGRVSPVIARIFAPIVLVVLVAYLIAMAVSAKSPYTDRQFLIIFNALLVGVMAIIFFSIAERGEVAPPRFETGLLLALSLVTIIVNGIALSAILFRISEWGLTPNRTAVLGSNVLILIHLVLVTVSLFRSPAHTAEGSGPGRTIAAYLPVYFVWAAIVTFLFPFLFSFQ